MRMKTKTQVVMTRLLPPIKRNATASKLTTRGIPVIVRVNCFHCSIHAQLSLDFTSQWLSLSQVIGY